jgi:hypothetical protein
MMVTIHGWEIDCMIALSVLAPFQIRATWSRGARDLGSYVIDMTRRSTVYGMWLFIVARLRIPID